MLTLAWLSAYAFVAAVASAGDKAAAESLFRQGRAAMDGGDYARACPLLAASLQEERAVGTLLNLALCHQKRGKTATAWAEFNEAAGMAERSGQPERAKGARKYAADLERSLSTITITVTQPVESLTVTRNGKPVAPATYGVAIAADPGRHSIEAAAPGYQSWSVAVELGGSADRQSVTIPRLVSGSGHVDQGPSGGPPAEDSQEQGSPTNPVLVTGIVVGGLGVVTLGVGIALGAIAVGETADLDEACPNRTGCDDGVITQRDSVAVKADVATGTIIGGSAAVVAGLLMVLLAPDEEEPEGPDRGAVRFAPQFAVDRAGIRIIGSF